MNGIIQNSDGRWFGPLLHFFFLSLIVVFPLSSYGITDGAGLWLFGSIQSIRFSITYFHTPYRIVRVIDCAYGISGVPMKTEVSCWTYLRMRQLS